MKHYGVYALQLTQTCTIRKHTHSTVQYHPPSFLYLSPDSWLHSLTLSEKKKKQPDKNERVFFQPLSPAALLPLLSFFLVHHQLHFQVKRHSFVLFFFGIIIIIIYYYLRKTTVLNSHMKKTTTWRKKQTDECRDG